MKEPKILLKDIIWDITFKSMLSEIRQYRPGYKLQVQIRLYGNLLMSLNKFAEKKERVIVRSNLLRILENYLTRELKN